MVAGHKDPTQCNSPAILAESRGYLEYYGQPRQAAPPDQELFDAMINRHPDWVSRQTWLVGSLACLLSISFSTTAITGSITCLGISKLAAAVLREHGVVLCDDAESTFAFDEFCRDRGLEPTYVFDRTKFFGGVTLSRTSAMSR